MRSISLVLLLLTNVCVAQEITIIPKPAQTIQPKTPGAFILSAQTRIIVDGSGMDNSVGFLQSYLKEIYDLDIKLSNETANRKNTIRLNYERLDGKIPGYYNLEVNKEGITINGDNEEGVFYAIQTLLQLLPTSQSEEQKIPFVKIIDYPRFEYRGLHLDVGRHFMPVSFIKKYIDYIALHKMNYFHWHLTEDQGWRIEIKKYPRLTEVGGWRNGTIIGRYPGNGNDNKPHGGFYTQEEIKEVVDYAAKRYISIVPEIEMPGHASAAIASYPFLSCFPNEKTLIPDNMISEASKKAGGKLVQETWGVFPDVFCAGNDSVFEFMENVIDEVIQLFPGKYIHVGGDECPKSNWKRCPRCQQRIATLGLKDEHALQSYFIQRMEKYVNKKGKTLIGWDEILEGGLAQNAVVMSWRGEQGGIEAARQKHTVIMTPGNWVYFDHTQSKNEDSTTQGAYTPVEETYAYEPVSKGLTAEQAKFIIGSQGNMWTEYMNNTSKVEYMLFPRLSALSEVLWTPRSGKNLKDFERRLKVQFQRYELYNINASQAFFELKSSILPGKNNQYLLWQVSSNVDCDDCFITSRQMTVNASDTFVNSKFLIIDRKKDPTGKKGITKDSVSMQKLEAGEHNFIGGAKGMTQVSQYINSSVVGEAAQMIQNVRGRSIYQRFSFNKATGKKIKLLTATNENFPGEGGSFGLINGVVSDKGFTSTEWSGWEGKDMDVIIDLIKPVKISAVSAHVLTARGSQPCKPQWIEVFVSNDAVNFRSLGKSTEIVADSLNMGRLKHSFKTTTTRYVKVKVKHFGIIPDGMPGAGNPARLFVDEIEID